jgi:hypothetical protein
VADGFRELFRGFWGQTKTDARLARTKSASTSQPLAAVEGVAFEREEAVGGLRGDTPKKPLPRMLAAKDEAKVALGLNVLEQFLVGDDVDVGASLRFEIILVILITLITLIRSVNYLRDLDTLLRPPEVLPFVGLLSIALDHSYLIICLSCSILTTLSIYLTL